MKPKKRKAPGCKLSDLAQEYYPHMLRGSAARKLKRDISNNPVLSGKLELTGYQRTVRRLTPRQKALIIRYLGPPV